MALILQYIPARRDSIEAAMLHKNKTIKIDKKYMNLKTVTDEFKKYQDPGLTSLDITKRRSNSSANTTSHSALSSSVAMS
ncbi:MAG: hypothetical protein Q7U04_13490 [Bacteriovorax sp.]|nr:hypothetical protein [Bacteriovorax sp.]